MNTECGHDEKMRRAQMQEALKLMQQMRHAVDEGYNIEVRKVPDGHYKVMKVKKSCIGIF